ncbi:MAG: SDR family oxidoreductase [Methanobacteriota archaeon]|nr:MAG: SDR family oxidoreductase [Euryarchaeota archaeon]
MTEKTVLIVSPFGGIGKSITEAYVKREWTIIGIGGESSAEEARKYAENEKFHFFRADHLNPQGLIEVFKKIRSSHSKIDGFIHLTGGSLISQNAGTIELSDYQRVIDLNLTSAFVTGQEAFKWLKEMGGGNLIFFGSTTGLVPSEKKLPYAVSKAGVHMLTRAFALEGAKHGILSNAIAPGYVMTDRHIDELKLKAKKKEKSYEDVIWEIKKKNPLHGLLMPEDLLPIVDLLLETKTITGEILQVDLGQTTIY